MDKKNLLQAASLASWAASALAAGCGGEPVPARDAAVPAEAAEKTDFCKNAWGSTKEAAQGAEPVAAAEEAGEAATGRQPQATGPNRESLRRGARACHALAVRRGWDGAPAPAPESTSIVATAPEAAAAPTDEDLCRAYQVFLLSTPGIWGDTPMLHILGIMHEVAVAAYEVRPSAEAEVASAQAGAPRAEPTLFSEWLGATAATVAVHLLNLGRGHWQAFSPEAAVPPDCQGGTEVAGTRREAGGGGDCMYLAFLASLDEQRPPPVEVQPTSGAAYARMLQVREDLGAYLDQHWHTPAADLGGGTDPEITLGALSWFGEPRQPDPLADLP